MAITKTGTFDTGAGYDIQIDAAGSGGLSLRSNQTPFISHLDGTSMRTTVLSDSTDPALSFGGIQTLAGGGYVLFGTTHSGLGRGVTIQTFDAAGHATSALLTPMSEQGNALSGTGYTVTPTADGGFALVYTSDASSAVQVPTTYLLNGVPQNYTISEGADVRIRYFDATGNPLASSVIASTDVSSINGTVTGRQAGTQFVYDSETLANGSVAYAYYDERAVGQDAGGFHNKGTITVQVSSDASHPGTPVKVDQDAFYTGNDGGLGGFNNLNGEAGANIVSLASGGFAVIWQEQSFVADAGVFGGKRFDGTDSFVRYFAADGTPTSNALEFLHRGIDLGNINKYVWAEALADGRIAVAYQDGTYGVNGTGTTDAYLGMLSGGALIDTLRVNGVLAGSGEVNQIYDLAVEKDGTIAIDYNDAHRVGPNNNPYNHTTIDFFNANAISPTIPVIADKPGNNTLTGTSASDLFVFDNTSSTGRDAIAKFATNDLLLTTAKIFDGNNDNLITFGSDKKMDLFSDGSEVGLKGIDGKAITKLAYEGVLHINGHDYFAYGTVGAAGEAAYHHYADTGAGLF